MAGTRSLFFVFFLCLAFHTKAQLPYRAPKQDSAIVIIGATIHIGNGQEIKDGAIEFIDGKINYIGDRHGFNLNSFTGKVIQAEGKQVYPGLIALNTILGLSEYEEVRATLDFGEVGNYNPDLRSIIAYNTDSKIIPTVRTNGVLLAQVVPQGGIISGTSSVVQLDAWNWEDAAYKTDEGIHLNWPSYLYNKFTDDMTGSAFNEKYSQQTEYIRQFFEQAKAYSQLSVPTKVNLRFEAMKELFTGNKNLYIHASYVKEIMSAVAFARQLGIKAVIVGGADAWKCAELLKQNNVPVVLQRTQVLPGTRDEDVNQPYKIAARLQKAGVLYCITDAGYWQQRNLPFQAGEAAGFGLSKEEALEAITLNAAKILGISNQTGSLESGKDANIIISDGDILDMATNHITMAFIQGRQLNLYNSQEYLYDMYRKKYGVR